MMALSTQHQKSRRGRTTARALCHTRVSEGVMPLIAEWLALRWLKVSESLNALLDRGT